MDEATNINKSLDEFGVPVVIENYPGVINYTVFDIQDVVHDVGLVECREGLRGSYKVIWAYTIFGKNCHGGRLPGNANDILDSPLEANRLYGKKLCFLSHL
ncbi:hypothetical protein MUCCIDRAFT_104758 [Mucor lusitanicus CBS 277.49]|uniref:Uncharacterized protein n=1 Tax=Mucor lusitanicus CBS 277.49 TaxID=747725 RepID=A0A168PJK3_MUCCL|nr:hypothetical protein MUCCIDRAFT_104758 [Mucor lusitanicus CBS 277.49]